MSHWLDKLERKIGRYAIPNLMNYLIVLYVIGFAVFTVNPLFLCAVSESGSCHDPAGTGVEDHHLCYGTSVYKPDSLCHTSICLLYAWQTDGRDPRNVPV